MGVIDKLKKLFSKNYHVESLKKTTRVLSAFSLTERVVFFVLALLFVSSAFILALRLNSELTISVPSSGGTLTEGIIGIPRFINPLLAISDGDRDLSALVYSGLMKVSSEGVLIPDLAERYEVSPSGLVYTFHLRQNGTFHDGERITADDVVFTIKKAEDPNLKSPKRASWEGVAVEKLSTFVVQFTLKQPYPPFLENTTLGILPAHIWQNVDTEQFTFSQFNIEPIGSGPYRVKDIKRSSGGIPTSYTLVPFEKYALGEAHISRLVLKFYLSEEALLNAFERHDVQGLTSVSPLAARTLSARGERIENVPLPRVFAVFFNQNEVPAFTYAEVRKALDMSLDRERIINEVLGGYAVAIQGPLPETLFGHSPNASSTTLTATTTQKERIQEAKKILERNGWKPASTDGVLEKVVKKETVRLTFSISTANTTELKETANIIKENWEAIGAKVSINLFDTGDLNQNVIRSRNYNALLFGEVIGRDLDLFAFWHSSQRNDPGLNVAFYTNITADKLLENARTLEDRSERIAAYWKVAAEIEKDVPAVFIYSPDFIYLLPPDIKGVNLRSISIPSDRFQNIYEWYIEKNRVWKFFEQSEPNT